MNRLRRLFLRCAPILVVTVALLGFGARPAEAQYYGYGYPGYGGGFGMGGYPYALGGYGNGVGLGGYGYGVGGYGYGIGGYGYGSYPAGYQYGYTPFLGSIPGYNMGMPYGWTGPGSWNPLFGVGTTPLAVESALTERYMFGRGLRTNGR
jgi:hypothetical protein